jgi:hypothetical protein
LPGILQPEPFSFFFLFPLEMIKLHDNSPNKPCMIRADDTLTQFVFPAGVSCPVVIAQYIVNTQSCWSSHKKPCSQLAMCQSLQPDTVHSLPSQWLQPCHTALSHSAFWCALVTNLETRGT